MVLAELKVDNIYIVCGYTDMRKSIAGLSAIIIQQFQMRPDEHSMFLFCGKRADRMKALIWEERLYCSRRYGGDPLYIRFDDEGVKMRVCGSNVLGEPAAQIDAMLKTGKNPHGESPFLLNHYA